MFLSSFVHRESLFELTHRWLCARLQPDDGLVVTRILICDGFVLGETLDALLRRLLEVIHPQPLRVERVHLKGQIREAICQSAREPDPRVSELIQDYRRRPEFYYRDVPINGAIALDREGTLLGMYRLKRPRRIAEKANRYLANWIFEMVQARARRLAEERARVLKVPLELLVTPPEEMAREFAQAEGAIASSFREGTIQMDRAALTIQDVGGIKIVADENSLERVNQAIEEDRDLAVIQRDEHRGDYRARSLVLRLPWDRDRVTRAFLEKRAWEHYANRGIPMEELREGIGSWLDDAAPDLQVEVILSTFSDMVESELGCCIHEERILAQRDTKVYRGYIPTNVEFLMEYLFSVGLSPQTRVDSLPIVLWGRYLPETMISRIRELYGVGENGPLY